MILRTSFEGSSELGAYACLTNTYCLIGHNPTSRAFASTFQCLQIPVIECTINAMTVIGSVCCGNKHGLIVPINAASHELQHIRNSLQNVTICAVDEKLNALGNNILVNDYVALVHPNIDVEVVKKIEDILKVDCIRHSVGNEPLVGTYAALNNVGMLVHPLVAHAEAVELAELLDVQVVAGTVNCGSVQVGGGCVVNDYCAFVGARTTVHEVAVMSGVFKIGKSDLEATSKAVIENLS